MHWSLNRDPCFISPIYHNRINICDKYHGRNKRTYEKRRVLSQDAHFFLEISFQQYVFIVRSRIMANKMTEWKWNSAHIINTSGDPNSRIFINNENTFYRYLTFCLYMINLHQCFEIMVFFSATILLAVRIYNTLVLFVRR